MKDPAETPRSGTQAATDAFWLISTAYLSQFLTLALAFVLRRQLGPAGMGYVAVTTLVATYAPYVSLGTMQAAEREIAIALGRRDTEAVESLEAVAAGSAFVLAVAAGAVLAGLGLSHWQDDRLLAAAFCCAAAVLVFQQFGIWATVRLRTRYRFRTLGWLTAATVVVSALLTVIGAAIGGATGALVAVGTGSMLTAAAMSVGAGLGRVALRRRAVARDLAVLAPGFLASGATAVLLASVDQLAVGFLLGTTGLGLYSAAYLGNGFVLRIPTLVGSVIYPRLQRELGASDDIHRVFRMMARTTDAIAVMMPAMVAVFFVALPALVYLMLPDYRPAVEPMRLLLVGVAGFAFGVPAIQYLLTVNQQWLEVAISAGFLAAMALGYLVAGATGQMSLLVAAGIDAVGYYGYGIAVQLAAYRAAGLPLVGLARLLPIHLLTGLELVVGSSLAGRFLARDDPAGVILNAAVQACLFAATWLALAALYVRGNDESRQDLGLMLGLVRKVARLRRPA